RSDQPRSAPPLPEPRRTCRAKTSLRDQYRRQAKADPCPVPRTATCAASPRKSLPPATAAEWPCCAAAASASAPPPYVPMNIPSHRPIPPTRKIEEKKRGGQLR